MSPPAHRGKRPHSEQYIFRSASRFFPGQSGKPNSPQNPIRCYPYLRAFDVLRGFPLEPPAGLLIRCCHSRQRLETRYYQTTARTDRGQSIMLPAPSTVLRQASIVMIQQTLIGNSRCNSNKNIFIFFNIKNIKIPDCSPNLGMKSGFAVLINLRLASMISNSPKPQKSGINLELNLIYFINFFNQKTKHKINLELNLIYLIYFFN